MSFNPVSGYPIQTITQTGQIASDYYLKLYKANTTTAINMSIDQAGTTLLAKAKIGDNGYPISNPLDNSTAFVPHVDEAFRLVIYTSEADADADNTAAALVNIPELVPQITTTNDGVLFVDNVSSLPSFDIADGQQISLSELYPFTGFAGGVFKWSALEPRANHDGGSILSPTVPWNGSIDDYVAGTGETEPLENGCWLRILELPNTVADVSQIAGLTGAYNDQQFSLTGWHPNSIVGGGALVWDATGLKSEHNGGTVFSPTVPWTTNTADYLNGVGETDPAGTGVLRRLEKEYSTPEDFGAKGDGVTNDSVSCQFAIDQSNGLIVAENRYSISTGLTLPESKTIIGSNRNTSTFIAALDGIDVITITGNYASIKSIGFTAAAERNSGTYIAINGAYRGNTISDFVMRNAFNGISINGETVITIIEDGEITDCKDLLGTGIVINGGNDTFINKIVMDSSGTEPFCGIRIVRTQAVWITDTDIIDFGTPLLLDPDGNNNGLITWCFFNGLALDTSDGAGLHISPSNGATIKGLFFDNCWSATNDRGVYISPVSGGVVDTVYFTDCTFYNNLKQGALIENGAGTVSGVEFNDCRFSGNSAGAAGTFAGLEFGDASVNFTVRDCFSGAQAGFSASQSYGYLVGANCNNYVVSGNRSEGNATGAYSDASFTTAASYQISNNYGFLTESKGTVNLTAQTTVSINHGLIGAPTTVQLTPLNTNVAGANYWAGTLTSTTFDVNIDVATTGIFSWTASI